MCTDLYEAYGYYKIAKTHIKTKSETCLVEIFNSLPRDMMDKTHRGPRGLASAQKC